MRIGARDTPGPDLFGHIAAIAVDDDDRIYVLDSTAHEVRVFDRSGTHVRSFGGKGAGPGEFDQPIGMAWGPDHMLWIVDVGNARFSVHDTSGVFISSHERSSDLVVIPWPGGWDRQNRLYDPVSRRDPTGNLIPSLVRHTSELQAIDTFQIPEYQADKFEIRTGQGLLISSASVPFSAAQRWTLTATGAVWSGTTDQYRLHRQNFAGDTVLIVGRVFTPISVTEEEKDEAVNGYEWFTKRGGKIDRGRIPPVKPAFVGFFIDDQDHLWVQPSRARDEADSYDIFDPNGVYLGNVIPGTQLSLFPTPVVRGDYIYAVTRDELDVPYVVRAQIVKP
jgi:hypothetical protein